MPKSLVRRDLLVNHDRFYAEPMTDFLVAEHMNAGTSLVRYLKDDRPKVYKKDVRAANPKSKDLILDFTNEHPNVLAVHKRVLAETDRPLTNVAVEGRNPEPHVLNDPVQLVNELRAIPPGPDDATEYHQKAVDVLEAIFAPQITDPHIEQKINQGRKRIDVRFSIVTQAKGFFASLPVTYGVRAPFVICEAKNYSTDVANPEFDQLQGRFGDLRGNFGILLTRTVDNADLALERCRDVARDGRGYIVLLTDSDLGELATAASEGGQPSVDAEMRRRFERVIS